MDHCQKASGCNALAYEMQLPMKKKGTKLKAEDEQMRCRKKKAARGPIIKAAKIMQSSFMFLLNYSQRKLLVEKKEGIQGDEFLLKS